MKRVLEVTKSSGGYEELGGKCSADGGVGRGAESLGLRQRHVEREMRLRVFAYFALLLSGGRKATGNVV